MARKDSEHQKKSMSKLFRGKAIFKPLNTGRIDEHVGCVREWIANIFFYTKNGTTIMIDAGYNYVRLKEKMDWLDMDPATIRHILITHQDTDHVGALERDSELLFKDATVYIGEIENRYLTGEVRRKVFHGAYSRLLDGHECTFRRSIRQEKVNAEVDGLIGEALLDPRFVSAMQDQLGMQVDKDAIEAKIKELKTAKKEKELQKDMLAAQMDDLDPTAKGYANKYKDYQKRLDRFYESIEVLEDALGAEQAKLN